MRGYERKFNGYNIYVAPGWEFTEEELDVISSIAILQKEKYGNITSKAVQESILKRDGTYDTTRFQVSAKDKEIWIFPY